MKIVKWREKKKNQYMIRVSSEEAIQLIQSLSSQIVDKNPNGNRLESYSDEGEYFSIAVHPKREAK